MSGAPYIGRAVRRVEDDALLRGRGTFVDDIRPPGTVHAAFLRSHVPSGRVESVDASGARALDGVVAVFDCLAPPDGIRDAGLRLTVPLPSGAVSQQVNYRPLTSEPRFVGDAVAVVLAEDRHRAEDGVAALDVAIASAPAVTDVALAVRADGPLVHPELPDNLAARVTGETGDVDDAFARADLVCHEQLRVHRGAAVSMECRGALAVPELDGSVTLYGAVQSPFLVKRAIAAELGLRMDRVRVVAATDVGGGFGPKASMYPEYLVLVAAAMQLGRPVKWIEDRDENLVATRQERDFLWDVSIAADRDGRIAGVRGTLTFDNGAYLPWGVITPWIAATTVPGPYRVPSYRLDVEVAYTNLVPCTPVRGAGRPAAVFAMERLLDRLADESELGRDEVRRRNLVATDAMPYDVGLTYRDGSPLVYDSGDYPATQAAALDRAPWFAEGGDRASDGRLRGVGLANYVEGGGLGPYEGATLRILLDGRVQLVTGAAAQGQGHRTSLAQVAADVLGVEPDRVEVIGGDTGRITYGIGTFGSRALVNAGSSVHEAGVRLADRLRALATGPLDAEPSRLQLVAGEVVAPDGRRRTFAELARSVELAPPGFAFPEGVEPSLEVTAYSAISTSTYSNGTHVAEVLVDPETCTVEVTRYVVAHDCGVVVNPDIVRGQIEGGVAHGIGDALYARLDTDDAGRPRTTSLLTYEIPLARNVPRVDEVHLSSPSPCNPLGVKGVGESGTIPVAAVVVSAVEDALRRGGVEVFLREVPLRPETLFRQIRSSLGRRETVDATTHGGGR